MTYRNPLIGCIERLNCASSLSINYFVALTAISTFDIVSSIAKIIEHAPNT